MYDQADFGTNIKFTDKDGIHIFNEGGNVVCYTSDGGAFVGKIISIGTYRQDKDAETERVIYLDTSKSRTSYSCEIIKLEDITYICTCPLYGANGFPDVEKAEYTIEIAKKTYDLSLKAVEVLIGIYDEAIAEGNTEMPEFDEVLRLVTENMEHLLSKEKIKKLIEGAKETVVK